MYPGERFNTITHLVGAVLALIATSVAITMAANRSDARTITPAWAAGRKALEKLLAAWKYPSGKATHPEGRRESLLKMSEHQKSG